MATRETFLHTGTGEKIKRERNIVEQRNMEEYNRGDDNRTEEQERGQRERGQSDIRQQREKNNRTDDRKENTWTLHIRALHDINEGTGKLPEIERTWNGKTVTLRIEHYYNDKGR
jgi:hypothetical protein